MKVKSEREVAQSCLTLSDPMDCSLPGSSIHGIFQARVLEWDAKGNQAWVFTERTDAEDETLILWPPDAKSRLIRKDPDLGKDQRQEKKESTEDEMVGWHHRLNGHE